MLVERFPIEESHCSGSNFSMRLFSQIDGNLSNKIIYKTSTKADLSNINLSNGITRYLRDQYINKLVPKYYK